MFPFELSFQNVAGFWGAQTRLIYKYFLHLQWATHTYIGNLKIHMIFIDLAHYWADVSI